MKKDSLGFNKCTQYTKGVLNSRRVSSPRKRQVSQCVLPSSNLFPRLKAFEHPKSSPPGLAAQRRGKPCTCQTHRFRGGSSAAAAPSRRGRAPPNRHRQSRPRGQNVCKRKKICVRGSRGRKAEIQAREERDERRLAIRWWRGVHKNGLGERGSPAVVDGVLLELPRTSVKISCTLFLE